MAQARLSMRKIREVLRLKADGLSDRQIAAVIGSARSTVQECLRRARDGGLTWPLPAELDEVALQARLYRRDVPLPKIPLPDFASVHRELSNFALSQSTRNKRLPIHVVFVLLLLLSVVVISYSVYSITQDPGNTQLQLITLFRLPAGALLFAFGAIYYIRWMTAWTTYHADAELLSAV